MLDGDRSSTRTAIRELDRILSTSAKPLVIWLGAGASAWAGLPTWPDLAEEVVREFCSFEPGFEAAIPRRLESEHKYPELFEHLRAVNEQRFYSVVHRQLVQPNPGPVYARFLRQLQALQNVKLVTTNFDDCLQSGLGTELLTLQRSDLETALRLLPQKGTFLLKLHGSLGSLKSCVLCESDYRSLLAEPQYLGFLQSLFSQSTVVFLGTSLSDRYLIDLLMEIDSARDLFGDGPHFIVSSPRADLPKSIRVLEAASSFFSDHRSTLHLLDLIAQVYVEKIESASSKDPDSDSSRKSRESAYFISDFLVAGTWNSSQTARIKKEGSDAEKEMVIGMGFVDEEVGGLHPTALHDLVVGLICFDKVVTPLASLGRLHDLLGPPRFWTLMETDAIRFAWFSFTPVVIYPEPDALAGGDLGHVSLVSAGEQILTLEEDIQRTLNPGPGHEELFQTKLLPLLKMCCWSVPEDDAYEAKRVVRAAILSPRLRKSLGLSDGIQVSNIPKWNLFPMMRLAHVALAASTCNRFGVRAAKLQYGTDVLASTTYGLVAERDTASEVASYVVGGRFSGDLGVLFGRNPGLFDYLLAYRDSPEAISLRREISEMLSADAGSEFIAALNGGLRKFIPISALENARHKFSLLAPSIVTPSQRASVVPLWQDDSRGKNWLGAWRALSKKRFNSALGSSKLTANDACPCGSGEKVKFCCAAALH